MTYWLLPCCYGNARLFCANKKEPLVSQEDTSPPNQPQTPRDQNKTTHVFNYLMGSSTETLPEAQRTQGIASKLELSLQQNRMPLALVKNLANM